MDKDANQCISQTKEKKKKRRPTFCPNFSRSFNASRSIRRNRFSNSAVKKNNTELAKTVNKLKMIIGDFQKEKMTLQCEIMELKQENIRLKSNSMDQTTMELEVILR